MIYTIQKEIFIMTRMNDTIYVTDDDNLEMLTSTDEVFL